MNTLILLSNFFPFGTEESYLEEECRHYTHYFDKVVICSLQLRPYHAVDTLRPIDDKIQVVRVPKLSLGQYLVRSLRILGRKEWYTEVFNLLKSGRFTIKRFVHLCFYVTRAVTDTGVIYKALSRDLPEIESSARVIYSYRFDYQPYVGLLLRRRLGGGKVVSRAHGFDLYEFTRADSYIPMREFLLQHLDGVYPVSKQGAEYLMERYGDALKVVSPVYLGSGDHGLGPFVEGEERVRLISVSTMTPVKRVHLIAKALSYINDRPIEWHHYGDGPLRREVEELCKEILPSNVSVIFHGHIQNTELLEVYRSTPFSLFVNVSSSEGIPVSIMEAMSFGVPCVATDVGGTSEIIRDKVNGYLVPADFEPEELSEIIRNVLDGSGEVYQTLRTCARRDWNEKYNADKNYRLFMEKLLSLNQ